MESQTIFEHPELWKGPEKRSHGHVPLRLWRAPSFRPWEAWAVIRIRNALYLRRVVWFRGPNDQIDGCEAPLTAATYDSVVTELSTITIPPFPNPKIKLEGLDGTSCGLDRREGSVWTTFEWWESGPEEWASLHAWHFRTIELFNTLLLPLN